MPAPEQYADMLFPEMGLDLSMAFGAQRQGTTRVGNNVRTYEPGTNRGRGGSRPGLLRYINDQVGGAANLIQHLNYVVDPQAQALPDYDPPDDITGGPNGNLGPNGDGSYADPTGSPRDTSGRLIRFGGTGIRMSKNRKNSVIRFIQGTNGNAAFGASSAVYTANVGKNDLLVAMVNMQASSVLNTVALADNRGNVWAPASATVTNTFAGIHFHLSLWYAIANASGACTVTATSSDLTDSVIVGVGEYSGTKTSGVLDNSSTSTILAATAGTYTATTGSVPVGQARSMVIAALLTLSASLIVGTSGYTGRGLISPTLSLDGFYEDHIGVSAAEAATFAVTTGGAVELYLAAGASFKPRV